MEKKEFILQVTRVKFKGFGTQRFEDEKPNCEVLLSDSMDVKKGDKIKVTLEKLE